MTFELPPLPTFKTEWVKISVHVRPCRRDLLNRLFPSGVSAWVNGLIEDALPEVIADRARRAERQLRMDQVLEILSTGAICPGSRDGGAVAGSSHVRNPATRPRRATGQRGGRKHPATATAQAKNPSKTTNRRARAESRRGSRAGQSRRNNPAA